MKRRLSIGMFALALTATTLGGMAARADEGPAVAKRLSDAGMILPLEKIVAAAKRIKPGEVLETELEKKGSGYVYEIEILDARGQVWEVKLDAKTAQLIKLEKDD